MGKSTQQYPAPLPPQSPIQGHSDVKRAGICQFLKMFSIRTTRLNVLRNSFIHLFGGLTVALGGLVQRKRPSHPSRSFFALKKERKGHFTEWCLKLAFFAQGTHFFVPFCLNVCRGFWLYPHTGLCRFQTIGGSFHRPPRHSGHKSENRNVLSVASNVNDVIVTTWSENREHP